MRSPEDPVLGYYDAKAAAYGSSPGADNAHARIPRLIGRGRRVLDVGCGRGHLGQQIRVAGNTVVGIEVSPVAADEARTRLDEVVTGSMDDPALVLPRGPFDVVVCADILEHLFDPSAALQRLVQLLTDDGVLIVSLPNVAHFTLRLSLLWGRWEYQDIGLLDRGHIRLFTRKTAIELIAGAGCELIAAECALSIPFAARPVRWVIDACNRLPEGWRNRLAPLIAAQFVFVARRSRGSSAI